LITLKEAMDLYGLSEEEYELWASRISRHGTEGLKTTLTQQFRTT
jgi:hypothetical protein